jgi:NAD(P)-dependent dehydrogenase (short-subunit alcohol dehydrogenase family)
LPSECRSEASPSSGSFRRSKKTIPRVVCVVKQKDARRPRNINVTSVDSSKTHMPLGGWYHASKFALEVLGDNLGVEVERLKIDIVVIGLGSIRTDCDAIADAKLRRLDSMWTMPSAACACSQVKHEASVTNRPAGVIAIRSGGATPIPAGTRRVRPRTTMLSCAWMWDASCLPVWYSIRSTCSPGWSRRGGAKAGAAGI